MKSSYSIWSSFRAILVLNNNIGCLGISQRLIVKSVCWYNQTRPSETDWLLRYADLEQQGFSDKGMFFEGNNVASPWTFYRQKSNLRLHNFGISVFTCWSFHFTVMKLRERLLAKGKQCLEVLWPLKFP